MRVCHVFAGVEGGSWIADQLEALKAEHGCEVFLAASGTEGPLPERCRQAGITVVPFSFNFLSGNIAAMPLEILALARWLRRERIDVVQSHVMVSTMLARPAAWLADTPVRLTMVTGPYFLQAPGSRRIELQTARMETGIIPSCQLAAELYRAGGIVPPLLCDTLYYGPRAARFDPDGGPPLGLRGRLGLADDTPLIGVVAHFYPRSTSGEFVPPELHGELVKGHDTLIAAMPHILQRHPTAKMLFAGRGWGPDAAAIEEEIDALIAAAGMTDAVLRIGHVDDVAGAYRDFDVSVQASRNENLGGTVESLLMARPTVATRVGGMPDAVVDGVTGLLVPPGDPARLAEAICALLDDRSRARSLGLAGRERMLAGFTLDVTAPRLARLYREQRAGRRGYRLAISARRAASAGLSYAPVVLKYARISVRIAVQRIYGALAGRLPGPVRRQLRRIAHSRDRAA